MATTKPRAKPKSRSAAVEETLQVLEGGLEDNPGSSLTRTRRAQKERRAQALSLLMAGFSYDQIGERLDISGGTAQALIGRLLSKVANDAADELRALENARLDRAQTAIWSQVLAGDLKSIDVFLRISQRRAKMNGLDEPTRVSLSINVRQEMEQALTALESVVLGEATVVDADPDPQVTVFDEG
jgi:DNA-binding CsgD family transcriptional regulator